MDFKEFLGENVSLINQQVEEILGETERKFKGYSDRLGELFKEFGELTKDGKRIRGALVLAGYQYCQGVNLKRILDAAAAVEIIQTSILAQDDIIDRSLTRRGKPALHIKLGGEHNAISHTICLSDLGIFLSFRLLSGLKINEAIKIKAINFFSQTLMQTVAGEMMDIDMSTGGDFAQQKVIKIGLLKTARYTISGPLILGGLLAGADLQTVKKLQIFGDSLGIAFQIQDDILGVFGDEKEIGKSSLSDIREGKATLLASFALESPDSEELKKYYGNQNITEDEAEKVRKIFRKSGALDFARSQTDKYFQASREALKDESQGLLYSLVNFIEGRRR